MSHLFQINFRREAFRRERAEARRRAVGLGIWLGYFGAFAVLLGLYGLNCAELGTRTRQLEKQIQRQRAQQEAGSDWMPSPAEATLVEPWVSDLARWRDLLGRLPRLLPDGARLKTLQFNPEGLSGGERKLVLTGVLRVDARRDRMAGVTDFVAVMTRDSLFTASFGTVRLVSTRALDGETDAEFTVECR